MSLDMGKCWVSQMSQSNLEKITGFNNRKWKLIWRKQTLACLITTEVGRIYQVIQEGWQQEILFD